VRTSPYEFSQLKRQKLEATSARHELFTYPPTRTEGPELLNDVSGRTSLMLSHASRMHHPILASRRPIIISFEATFRQALKTQYTSSPRPTGQLRRCFQTTGRRLEERLSFRGQLYESTAQRLARERAEEAKFIETRHRMGPSQALKTVSLTIRESGPYTAIGRVIDQK